MAVFSCSTTHGDAREVDDLIDWIAKACPKATDTEKIVRLDQVAGKAVTDWMRKGEFRSALSLSLAYSKCLDGIESVSGTEGFKDRARSLEQIMCFLPMAVFEKEQSVDESLARACLDRCTPPAFVQPDEEEASRQWAEETRRYIHLFSAVESPADVAAEAERRIEALGSAEANPKAPDPLFATRALLVAALVAKGDLDGMLDAFEGKDAACRSPFLSALGIMMSFKTPRRAALPLLMESLVIRGGFEPSLAMARLARERFDGAECVVPGLVSTMLLSAMDEDRADRYVELGRAKDLALLASLTMVPSVIPGSLNTRMEVMRLVVKESCCEVKGRWLRLLGDAEMESGMSVKALGHFSSSVELLGESAGRRAVSGVFRAVLANGKTGSESAVQAARMLLESSVKDRMVLETLARIHSDTQKIAAIVALNEAVKSGTGAQTESFVEAITMIVDNEPGSDVAEAAVRAMNDIGVPNLAEDAVVWRLVKGRHYVESGDMAAAERAMKAAFRTARPNMRRAVDGVAAFLRWLAAGGHYKMLDRAVRLAGKVHVTGVEVLADLAGIVGNVGEKRRARSLLREAVKMGPEGVEQWLSIANAYARMDDSDRAVKALSMVGPRESWGTGPWMAMGRIEMSRKRYRDAIGAYTKAAGISGGSCEPLFYRGLTMLLLGDPSGAETDFLKCIDMGVTSHQVLGGLGYARFDQSRYEEAASDFRKALDQSPDTPDNRLGLALSLFRLERSEEAMDEYRRAVVLEPSMGRGHEVAEKKGYIYTAIEKKAWDDMVKRLPLTVDR